MPSTLSSYNRKKRDLAIARDEIAHLAAQLVAREMLLAGDEAHQELMAAEVQIAGLKKRLDETETRLAAEQAAVRHFVVRNRELEIANRKLLEDLHGLAVEPAYINVVAPVSVRAILRTLFGF